MPREVVTGFLLKNINVGPIKFLAMEAQLERGTLSETVAAPLSVKNFVASLLMARPPDIGKLSLSSNFTVSLDIK